MNIHCSIVNASSCILNKLNEKISELINSLSFISSSQNAKVT